MVRRPSHSTVVAYLALFLALCTGAAFAATKIKSSKQIKRGVVNSGDVKDAGLSGQDVADGGLTGADLLDGGISGSEIANGSVAGGKLTPDSVTGDEVDESSLEVARGFSTFEPGGVSMDNGFNPPSVFPRDPEGSLAALALPPGRYLITAHALVSANSDTTGGYYCFLGSSGDYVETGGYVSNVDFDILPVTPSGLSVSTIRESDNSFLTRLICSDAGTNLFANDRGIEAIKLKD